MKPNKCYAIPVVLYVMAPNRNEAKQLVKRRVAIEKEETIGRRWPDGPDFIGIIGLTHSTAADWDTFVAPFNSEKYEKTFRKTWTPK